MPLNKQVTTLNSGRGNFAPSVSYYAGIKAPNQPSIHLPRQDASFNIDLSSIGNAMIAAKESETKLGLAAVEMEENLRNAERDRQFKLDLLKKEQAYEDARQDKKLAMDLQIAKLNNATELEKLKYSKSKAIKDQTKAMANLALSSDKELRQRYVDYANGNLGELEWSTLLNEKINSIAVNTGANVQDLYTMAAALDYKQGLGATIQANVDEEKTLRNNQLTQDISLGGTLNPQASESDKAAIGAEFRESVQNTVNMNRILSNPESTQMEKDMARRILNNNQDKLIDTYILRAMTDINNNMRNQNNPVEFLEASKDAVALTIANNTGSDYGQVRRRTDAMFKLYHIDGTLKDITDFAKDDSAYLNNAYSAFINQYRIGTLKDAPMLRAAVAFGSDFIKGLPESGQEAFYNVMANSLIGNIQKNYTWTDEAGTQHTGYRWIRRGNEPLSYDNMYVSELADELGMTPMGAVYYLASESMKEAPTSLRTHKMMPEDGNTLLQNTVMTLSGNPNKDLSAAGMTPEQVLAVQNNIDTCVQSGNGTPQQIHAFSETLPEPYKTSARHLENKWSGAAKLGRFLGGGKDAAYFYESVQYMNPVNLTLAEIKSALGKSVTEKDKNSLQLKNTQSFYTIKDGRVYIDFTQQGFLIRTGTEELQKRATYVRHQLERAGLTVEEQVDFYDRFYPNMTNVDPRAGDILPIWLQDAFSIMQDYTIGRGAVIDTQFASWLDNKNKEWLNKNASDTMTADEAFNAMAENRRINEETDKELEAFSKERREQVGEEARQTSLNNPDTVINVETVYTGPEGNLNIGISTSGEKVVYINGERFIVPDKKSDEEILEDYKNGDLK